MSDVYGLTERSHVTIEVNRVDLWVDVVTYDGNWEEFETEGIYVKGVGPDITPLIDGTAAYDRVIREAWKEVTYLKRTRGKVALV